MRAMAEEVCAAAEATLARFVAASPAGATNAGDFRAFFRAQLSPKVREAIPAPPRSMEAVYSPVDDFGSAATEAAVARAVRSASRSPLSALSPSSLAAASRRQRSSQSPRAAVYDAYRPPYALRPIARSPIYEGQSPFAAAFEQAQLQRMVSALPQASPPPLFRSTSVMETDLDSLLARSAISSSQAIARDAASGLLSPQHSHGGPAANFISTRPYSPLARSPVHPISFSARAAPNVLQ